MDKVQVVFDKYAGVGTLVRNVADSAKRIFKSTIKGKGLKKNFIVKEIPDHMPLPKTPVYNLQAHNELHDLKVKNIYGKPSVSPPNREKLLRDVEAEKFKRQMGI